MSLSADAINISSVIKSYQDRVKEAFDAYTTDRNKTLLRASAWNAVVAVFASANALSGEPYNAREVESDIFVHLLSSATCLAQVFIPSDAPGPMKSMLDAATKATILANKLRIAGICVSVAYGTQTIPLVLDLPDLGNHDLTNAVLEKHAMKV